MLGTGSSGAVFEAIDSHLGRVAIKFSYNDEVHIGQAGKEKKKLHREVALMKRAAHEHVVKLHEHHVADEERLFGMVLELLERGNLAEHIKNSEDGRMREFEVVQMAFDVLSALEFMHDQDVIHRDLKPANIVLTKRGDRVVYKVIDFSISAIEQQSREDVSKTLRTGTETLKSLMGTPHYMACEQFDSTRVVTKQVDLWSLGVVIFECLSGKLPFGDSSNDLHQIMYAIVREQPLDLSEVIDDVGAVTDAIAEFTLQALQKDLDQRYGSVAEMTMALNDAITMTADAAFGLFISYRVWCDQECAKALYTATSKCQLRPGRENQLQVYLDKVRMVDGQPFDENFARALAASTVFAPLISAECLKSFVELGITDKEDFVLAEWMMALELYKRDIVKAIFPIVFGEQDKDGKFDGQFFAELRDGNVSWPASHHHEAGNGTIPDVVSAKTIALANKFLRMLEPPMELSEALSVKDVVKEMLRFEAMLPHFENDSIESLGSKHGDQAKTMARKHVAQIYAQRAVKVVGRHAKAHLDLVPESEPEPEPQQVPSSVPVGAHEQRVHDHLNSAPAPSELEPEATDSTLALVREIFTMHDVDADGKLNQDEYVGYLKAIRAWETHPYTDENWDARWPLECKVLECAVEGVTREAFETILYGVRGKHRWGQAENDLEKSKETPQERATALLIPAIMEGHTEVVARLIKDEGADANTANKRGTTALHVAAMCNDIDTMELLVKAGANMETANNRRFTPLMWGAMEGCTEAVQWLLEQGADWRKTDDGSRLDALTIAKGQRKRQTVAVLEAWVLAHGAD